jgi:hypothetical protein
MKGAPAHSQHPKDAQPPRNGAFAKASRKADFARGFGGGTALNKQTVATRSLLAELIGTCR